MLEMMVAVVGFTPWLAVSETENRVNPSNSSDMGTLATPNSGMTRSTLAQRPTKMNTTAAAMAIVSSVEKPGCPTTFAEMFTPVNTKRAPAASMDVAASRGARGSWVTVQGGSP